MLLKLTQEKGQKHKYWQLWKVNKNNTDGRVKICRYDPTVVNFPFVFRAFLMTPDLRVSSKLWCTVMARTAKVSRNLIWQIRPMWFSRLIRETAAFLFSLLNTQGRVHVCECSSAVAVLQWQWHLWRYYVSWDTGKHAWNEWNTEVLKVKKRTIKKTIKWKYYNRRINRNYLIWKNRGKRWTWMQSQESEE